MDDTQKREQLIKSYEGQIKKLEKTKLKKRKKISDERIEYLISKWQERIDKCRNGEPLDFLGKRL